MSLKIDDKTVIRLVHKYQRRTGKATANDAIKAALIRGMEAMRDEALMAEKFGISDPAHKVGAVVFVDQFRQCVPTYNQSKRVPPSVVRVSAFIEDT